MLTFVGRSVILSLECSRVIAAVRVLVLAAAFFAHLSLAHAQTPEKGVPPPVTPLFDKVTIMPYVTGSLNLFSGKAFPANATGAGFGGGLSFDLTKEGQKVGLMFDFAFQDMRGFGANGSCIQLNPDPNDSLIEPADAYHYWQYVLFEPFLKFQGGARNGYFMIGASFGLAVISETENKGVTYTDYSFWDHSEYATRFRLDIRAGLGVKLADIGKHQLILEARAGYPITNAISNYASRCTGGELGNWRIITMQANLGLRI